MDIERYNPQGNLSRREYLKLMVLAGASLLVSDCKGGPTPEKIEEGESDSLKFLWQTVASKRFSVDEEGVYIYTDKLKKLDKDSGLPIWTSQLHHGSEVISGVHDGVLITSYDDSSTSGGVRGLDSKTGAYKWDIELFSFDDGYDDISFDTLVRKDGTLFIDVFPRVRLTIHWYHSSLYFPTPKYLVNIKDGEIIKEVLPEVATFTTGLDNNPGVREADTRRYIEAEQIRPNKSGFFDMNKMEFIHVPGEGYISPIVVINNVGIFSGSSDAPGKPGFVVYDIDSRSELWRKDNEYRFVYATDSFVLAEKQPPRYSTAFSYTHSYEVFDFKTGEKIWERKTRESHILFTNFFYKDSNLYSWSVKYGTSHFYLKLTKLDPESGEEVWHRQIETPPSIDSDILWVDERHMVLNISDKLYLLDSQTGVIKAEGAVSPYNRDPHLPFVDRHIPEAVSDGKRVYIPNESSLFELDSSQGSIRLVQMYPEELIRNLHLSDGYLFVQTDSRLYSYSTSSS